MSSENQGKDLIEREFIYRNVNENKETVYVPIVKGSFVIICLEKVGYSC